MQDGAFVWYELATSDAMAARDFYASVIGWTVNDSGMPGMQYLLASAGEHRIAGIMPFPPGMEASTPSWYGYVLASDVDAAAARTSEAGGSVHRPPADIPGIGRFAVVADPQGAVFMLFRGEGTAEPAPPQGRSGTVGWNELATADWPSTFAFYQSQFGWEKAQAVDMGPMGTYQTFSIGGAWAGGIMNAPPGRKPGWLFYFVVDGATAAMERIKAAGGTVEAGPMQVPGGSWIVHGTDPQGARFGLTAAQA